MTILVTEKMNDSKKIQSSQTSHWLQYRIGYKCQNVSLNSTKRKIRGIAYFRFDWTLTINTNRFYFFNNFYCVLREIIANHQRLFNRNRENKRTINNINISVKILHRFDAGSYMSCLWIGTTTACSEMCCNEMLWSSFTR